MKRKGDKRIVAWVKWMMWVGVGVLAFACSPRETRDKGGDLKVKAGDGCVYVQWRPWIEYFNEWDKVEVEVWRSMDGINFDVLVGEYSNQIPGMFAGIVDTGLENGRDFWYCLKFIQLPLAEESLIATSDTCKAHPQAGLPWPVPPAPTNPQVAEFYPDSLVISWTPPQPNDSTYQIEKKDGESWIVPLDWMDGPLMPPIYLPDARLVIRDTSTDIYGWLRIGVFVGGMLSEPSDSLLVSWPKGGISR